MATIDDLNDFHQFAGARIASGGADSLDALLANWKARREYEETVAAIKEGLADVEADRVSPVHEAFAEVRKKLGLVVD